MPGGVGWRAGGISPIFQSAYSRLTACKTYCNTPGFGRQSVRGREVWYPQYLATVYFQLNSCGIITESQFSEFAKTTLPIKSIRSIFPLLYQIQDSFIAVSSRPCWVTVTPSSVEGLSLNSRNTSGFDSGFRDPREGAGEQREYKEAHRNTSADISWERNQPNNCAQLLAGSLAWVLAGRRSFWRKPGQTVEVQTLLFLTIGIKSKASNSVKTICQWDSLCCLKASFLNKDFTDRRKNKER